MEPIGKAVLGLTTDKITAFLSPILSRDPQFAYLPWRSTQDCLIRISHRSAQVQQLVQTHAKPLHSRQQGRIPPALYGGLVLVLDISKAFDSVNRSRLMQHLATLDLPVELQTLIRAWHQDTAYHLIQITKGVRQGCRLAPILWACYVHCFRGGKQLHSQRLAHPAHSNFS